MTASLIINADDYGYYKCVSSGIRESHANGVVTATGIMANSPSLNEEIDALLALPGLDTGVHLNLTAFTPLTEDLLRRVPSLNGQFPGKFELVRLLVTGKITSADIESEWSAQIERCLDLGASVNFLNSHEHVHMFPMLFRVVRRLADKYDIDNVRIARPDAMVNWTMGGFIRDMALSMLAAFKGRPDRIRFIGLAESGRLSLDYLSKQFETFQSGMVYELMCHPGVFDEKEIVDSQLIQYHDWEHEKSLLESEELKDLINTHGFQLIGFKDLLNV